MKYNFVPSIAALEPTEIIPDYSVEQLSTEPMVFGASLFFAYDRGGEITKKALFQMEEQAIKDGFNPDEMIIDTRVNMVMPGMYPSIPGWHCDDVPRTDDSGGQPDLGMVSDDCVHYMMLISDTGATRTEFVYKPFECDIDDADVWASLNTAVEEAQPKTMMVPERKVVRFNQTAIHRASMAKTSGWRFFIRGTIGGPRKPVDRMRTQVQVYITKLGW